MGCVVGLTGGLASGKSLVSSFMVRLGAIIIDADKLAHDTVVKGSEALEEIVLQLARRSCYPPETWIARRYERLCSKIRTP